MLKRLLSMMLVLILITTGCTNIEGGDADTTFRKKESNLKIISLRENQTEILISLGLEENIVGLNTFDSHYTKDIEAIGDISGLDMEKMMELDPDLIIDYNDEFAESFKDSSLEYFSFSPNSLDSIKDNILELGEITNTMDNAEDLVDNIDSEIEKIINNVSNEEKNTLFEVWHQPLTFAKEGSYINELIHLLGGTFSEDLDNVDVYIALDHIPERTHRDLMEREDLKSTKAYNDGKIFLIDKDLMVPGMKIIDALEKISNMIY